MKHRLARLATTAAAFTVIGGLSAAPADAASCGFLGLLCPAPAPAPTTTTTAPVTTPPAQPQPAPEPVAVPAPAPAAPRVIAELHELNVRLLQLVNQERAAAGLVPLASRPEIAAYAAGQSTAMATRRDIWHNAGYFTAATRKALGAVALGENVAVNGSLEGAHQRLMASPGHRANILNGRYDAAGVSVVQDEDGTLYITEDFVDSAAAKAKAKPKAKKATKKATKKAKKTTKR